MFKLIYVAKPGGSMGDTYRMFLDMISGSRYIVAFTGAGVSAESGIPTFRDKGGLWERFRPEELASVEGFMRDPVKVWRWYIWRMRTIYSSEPNYAHLALALLERKGRLRSIITQNIDGLHTKAGSRRVIEIHGSIWRVRCARCAYRSEIKEVPNESELPPTCPECGYMLRPDVVWFGEPLDNMKWSMAVKEATRSDLFMVIGTSGAVYPAAELPYIARNSGSRIIVIDPNPTAFDDIADLRIWSRASEFFRGIWRDLESLPPLDPA